MGQLEQFAKQLFEEETTVLTGGAAAWQGPVELGLSEVRLDGLLRVHEPARLAALPAPWCLAGESDEVVPELKLPGDHLNELAVERALLRRQAYQVVRLEAAMAASAAVPKPLPLWMVAPHLPRWLRGAPGVAPGCYRLASYPPFVFLWVAANELPLRDELVPFLVARSGSALDAFVRWSAARRPGRWVLRMVQFLPMSPALRDELLHDFPKTDDPEVRARQRMIVQALLDGYPDIKQALREEGRAEGRDEGREEGRELEYEQLYEQRLGRALSEAERATLRGRWGRLGAKRLGDVLLGSSAEALAAWLADPEAC